jgi:uncharacterized damage-inducible protein DinB
MDAQVTALNEMLRLGTRLFVNSFEGVDDEIARVQPTDSTNNMAFVGLHVLDARAYLARFIGLDYHHPFTGPDEVKSIDDMSDYPAVEDILDAWREVSELLEEKLPMLSNEELARESSQQFPVEDRSVLGGLAFLLTHESFHIGQLAFLRKYLGLSSMSYS